MQKTGVFENFCLNLCNFVRKLQTSTSIFNIFAEKQKMLNWSTICSAKNRRFWEFLLEFCAILWENCRCRLQYSTCLQKAKNAQLKHNLQCKIHAFLSISAWICTILWENCGCQHQSIFNIIAEKRKMLSWKHNFQCKKQVFLRISA